MINRFCISLIVIYQKYYSAYRYPVCRFSPSCSTFAVEALKKHRFITASRLITFRILRCGPWCAGGEDPVP